jgi:hypothetical protein
MGPIKVKPDGPYIHRCQALTDKYNLIFIGFKTDEYNLNVYVDTDEYVTTDKWTLVSCSEIQEPVYGVTTHENSTTMN